MSVKRGNRDISLEEVNATKKVLFKEVHRAETPILDGEPYISTDNKDIFFVILTCSSLSSIRCLDMTCQWIHKLLREHKWKFHYDGLDSLFDFPKAAERGRIPCHRRKDQGVSFTNHFLDTFDRMSPKEGDLWWLYHNQSIHTIHFALHVQPLLSIMKSNVIFEHVVKFTIDIDEFCKWWALLPKLPNVVEFKATWRNRRRDPEILVDFKENRQLEKMALSCLSSFIVYTSPDKPKYLFKVHNCKDLTCLILTGIGLDEMKIEGIENCLKLEFLRIVVHMKLNFDYDFIMALGKLHHLKCLFIVADQFTLGNNNALNRHYFSKNLMELPNLKNMTIPRHITIDEEHFKKSVWAKEKDFEFNEKLVLYK